MTKGWKGNRYRHSMAARGIKNSWRPNVIADNIINMLPNEKTIKEQMERLEGETAYWWDSGGREIEIEIGEINNVFEGTFWAYDSYGGRYIVKLEDLHFEKEDI